MRRGCRAGRELANLGICGLLDEPGQLPWVRTTVLQSNWLALGPRSCICFGPWKPHGCQLSAG